MPIPIITVEQMRQWEKATWATGRTEEDVIRRVGHIVALRASQMTKPGDLVVILAGKGHNGDDARYASQDLSDREVCLINVTEPQDSLQEFQDQLPLRPSLILDGLFGIGLNRELDANWIRFIEAINKSGVPVLAVDVPSGLNADTGQPMPVAVAATVTLTLGAPKMGMLHDTAWPSVARLEVAPEIGLVPLSQSSDLQWTDAGDFHGFLPRRPVAAHKGTFGHLCIVAGSRGYHGAAVLCARGALRAQPGLVSLITSENTYDPVASQLQAAMVHAWRPGMWEPGDFTGMLIGPGLADPSLSEKMKSEARHLWTDIGEPVVADASALDWLPSGQGSPKAIRVMTPHPGEAARLLGKSAAAIQRDRPSAVRELSRKFGNCWVVLKGHQTLVGQATGPITVNSSGNPSMAQGGTGDVLAGFLAGLLCQPALQTDPGRTIRYAVWQHGATGDFLAETHRNWSTEDLCAAIGRADANS